MSPDTQTVQLPPGAVEVLRQMDRELKCLDINLGIGCINLDTYRSKVAFVEANAHRKLLKLQEATS